MKINEICKKANMTKKAVEYYQSKGLVDPETQPNGYREFSEADLSRLKEIALFRKLNLSINEIKKVLESDNETGELIRIKKDKMKQLEAQTYQIEMLEALIEGHSHMDMRMRLTNNEKHLSIIEKIRHGFPGFYGKYMSVHYGRFLMGKVNTQDQKHLIDQLIKYLDQIEFGEVSLECQNLMEELDQSISETDIKKLTKKMTEVYGDIETYWENNKEQILRYKDEKKSTMIPNAVMTEFESIGNQIKKSSKYEEVFIPTMRTLSPEFDAYYKMLLRANHKLVSIAPELYE